MCARQKAVSHPLVRQMLQGHRLSLARVITKLEDRDPDSREILKELYPNSGRAQVWGITGPPGAGKSTLVDRIAQHLRRANLRVAIVAIDPSSPFTGGAILGDRIRMQNHSGDEGVFIRSLGTRGIHGGLSRATKEVVLALDAAGFDMILVETAGVGQTELEILNLAQTVIVTLVPESGDSIQMMKAGLLEIADVFTINKSDRPGADQLLKDLRTSLDLAHARNTWIVPVHKTQANQDVGIEELIQAISAHQAHLTVSGERKIGAQEFLKATVTDILTERLQHSIAASFETSSGIELLGQLLNREIDPQSAADLLSKI